MNLRERAMFGVVAFHILAAATQSRAALAFDTHALSIPVAAVAKVATGSFNFKNTGSAPVTIRSAEPTCMCTTVEFEKRSYAPGETGFIKFSIDVGADTGMDVKQIRVVTDEAGSAAYQLLMTVTVAPLATFQRRRVEWAAGAAPTEETVIIESLVDEPIKIDRVLTGRTDFVAVRYREITPGKKFELVIKPITERRPFDDRLTVVLSAASGVTKVFPLYARGN